MIPLSQPDITEKERKAVLGVLKTPYLSLGPKMREFEEKLAKYIGVKYAVALNSGTAGLHLIIKALNIGNGSASAKATADKDEVITTPFSFIASANCILFERAKPVFVDIDEKTLNIDSSKIEEKITKKTKAILAVDIFGHPADWDKILKIAKKYKLKIIEDNSTSFADLTFYHGKGCERCNGSGYKGRVAVMEILENSEVIQNCIIKNSPSNEIEKMAMAQGMINIFEDGMQKSLTGITTIEEVLSIKRE